MDYNEQNRSGILERDRQHGSYGQSRGRWSQRERGEVVEYNASAFSAGEVDNFDAIAFGCPAMGAEVLEEGEFQPMWDDVKGSLKGKKIALFGSYGWGSGEWMDNWKAEAEGEGAVLAADPVMANNAPDDAALAQCKALGEALA